MEGIFIVLMWLRARNNVELIPVAEQGSLRGAAQARKNNQKVCLFSRKPEKNKLLFCLAQKNIIFNILEFKIHPIIISFSYACFFSRPELGKSLLKIVSNLLTGCSRCCTFKN